MRLPEVDGSSPVQLEVVKGDLESDLEVGFMNKDGHPDLGLVLVDDLGPQEFVLTLSMS